MHKFCLSCSHRLIPKSIKEKFNENIRFYFVNCPMKENEKIEGCVVKYFLVDWKKFTEWMNDTGILEEEEKKMLKLIGISGG